MTTLKLMAGQSIGELDPSEFRLFKAVSLTVEGYFDRALDWINLNNGSEDPVEEPTAVIVLKVNNR
ncbi:hypothetical protein [Microvirga sp. M2]|uniref:hypothetical protein n=1 Tax=Microvirga sp. M2 TaxID=3073270 RepID=UPI0039C0FD52